MSHFSGALLPSGRDAPKLLLISDSPTSLTADLAGIDVEFCYWPQQGGFGQGAREAIDGIARRKSGWENIDCVVCEYVTSAPVAYAIREAGYRGPVIWIPYYTPFPLDKFVHALLMMRVLGEGDMTVALSPSAHRLLAEIFGVRTECIPVPGIDYSIFTRSTPTLSRRDLGLSEGPLLVYAGRFARDKHLSSLLAAFEQVRQAEPAAELLLCIADLDESYREALASKFAGVHMRRNVCAGELADMYRTADVFVSGATSFYENLGLAPLEAAACGTPAVVPAWDGFRDYYQDANGRLVGVRTHESVADDGYSYAGVDRAELAAACLEVVRGREQYAPRPVEQLDVERVRLRVRSLIDDRIAQAIGRCSNRAGVARAPATGGLTDELAALDSESVFELCVRSDLNSLRWSAKLRRELYFEFFASNDRFYTV